MTSKHTLDENRAIADQAIKKYGACPLLHLINGELVPSLSHGTFENHSPGDQRRLGSVAEGDPEDIAAAAAAAAAAFPDWVSRSGADRQKILHRIAALSVDRADESAAVEAVDTGQAIRFMSSAAIRGAENFRYFSDAAPGALDGKSMPTKTH